MRKSIAVLFLFIASSVCAQGVDPDVKTIVDSLTKQIQGLQQRIEAHEKRLEKLEGKNEEIDKSLVTATNLHLFGGFRVPNYTINRDNTASLSGSFDRLNGKWIANHGNRDRIIEYTEPGEVGTGKSDTWPELIPGRWGQPFQSVDKIGAAGVQWLDKDRVLCSGRKSYRSGFEANWVCEFNLATGNETLIPQVNPEGGDNANFHLHQAFGAGFCRIPQSYADSHTGGRTIGMGRGGYDVLGSPLGPALAAWKPSDTFPHVVLYDYPTEHPARRDSDYRYPVDADGNTTGGLGIWKAPDDAGGFWQGGDAKNPAWIDHPKFKGILAPALQGRKTLDYRAQGDWGSGPVFTVADPVQFYSSDSNGNRGGHADETWNQTLPPGTVHSVIYVHDPDDLKHVEFWDFPWDERIIRDAHPNRITTVVGMFWDSERQLLWVCIANAWGERFAVLAAYELE